MEGVVQVAPRVEDLAKQQLSTRGFLEHSE